MAGLWILGVEVEYADGVTDFRPIKIGPEEDFPEDGEMIDVRFSIRHDSAMVSAEAVLKPFIGEG